MAKTTSNTPFIKAIFTNLLFVVGIALMVIGFVRGASTISKIAFFDQYPLPSYEESRCEFGYYPDPMLTSEAAEEQKKQMDEQKRKCQADVERGRSVQKVEDVTFSVSSFVAGIALALIFKQFIFQKR